MKTKTKLKTDELALLDAAREGNAAEVRRLLGAGVAADVKDDRAAPWDVTPLMCAARAGKVEIVKLLIAAGANVNARDKHFPGEGSGRTPLHYAARARQVEAAREL